MRWGRQARTLDETGAIRDRGYVLMDGALKWLIGRQVANCSANNRVDRKPGCGWCRVLVGDPYVVAIFYFLSR